MSPPRDSFGLALSALRQRLRDGADAPGAPLPIQLIAAQLRLSTTPVREALSRLAGEELVEKRGPTYTRPLLDGPALAELYDLRRLYLAAALAPGAARRAGRRRWPPRPPLPAADPLDDPAAVVDALYLELMLTGDDLMLAQAYQRTAERLAPFRSIEARLIPDLAIEAQALMAAFQARDKPTVRARVRRHHRVRIDLSPTIARLALGEKYRSDIV